MKKLLFFALPLLILYGCSKEEANPQMDKSGAYVFKVDGDNPVWEFVTMEEPVNSLEDLKKNGNSVTSHGDYTAFGSFHITFNGTQNNGGAHGSATLMRSSGPFELHVDMETVSVVVQNGNKAIYGGIITEVIVNTFPPIPPPPPPPPCPTFPNCPPPPPPPSCSPYDLGSYVYFQVIDNGQGNNAPADQYTGLIVGCNELLNGGAGFPWFIFGTSDVQEGDRIKVNN